jgi:hypothetical protein
MRPSRSSLAIYRRWFPDCRQLWRAASADACSLSRSIATVADLAAALERKPGSDVPTLSLRALIRHPAARVAALVLIAGTALGIWQWRVSASRARWVRTVAAPEIHRLSDHGDYAEAFLLARQSLVSVPDDPHLRQLWLNVSTPAVITTEPAGADVAFAAYRAPTAWFYLGRTPLKDVRVPRAIIRLRVSKDGFQPIEGSGSPGAFNRYRLIREQPAAGMVRVVSGRDDDRFGAVGRIDDFWIDRLEVTNREFKAFVDQGGYRNRDYWREPFVQGERSVPWQDAVERFRDATGRPGPATWASGTYPAGRPISREWRELVRSGSLRGIRRQKPADGLSLVPRG